MENNCWRREGINQKGCLWVFINIFGSNQKHLLMDNKQRSKRFTGNYEKLNKLTCSCNEHVESNSCNNESEEKFKEIIKKLIVKKQGEIITCKDLLDAFHVLDSEVEHEEEAENKKGRFLRRYQVDLSSKHHSSCKKSKNRKRFSRFFIGLIKRRLHSSVEKKSLFDDDDVLDDQSKHVTNEDSKRIMSSLYIEAKKHLSEMLANGEIDLNLPDKEVPIILGKILSFHEFSSPEDSPRLIPEQDQITEKPKIMQCNSGTNDLADETYISLVSRKVENVDEDMLELCEEEQNKQSLNKETLNQEHTSIKKTECKETTIGVLSPVSVLEPLFTDDASSPTRSIRFNSAEMRIQPLCIRFDEDELDKDNYVETNMEDDKESTLTYIKAIVKSSIFSLEQLLKKPFYSKQLLDQELTNEIVFYTTQLCNDKNLLHDCINEVLIDFWRNELSPGPQISHLKPEISLLADVEIAAKVAQEGVYWHLLPLPSPHTLDEIVKKDMTKTGSWMDLRFDIGCIVSDTSEMILDELVEEFIRSYRDMIVVEPVQDM